MGCFVIQFAFILCKCRHKPVLLQRPIGSVVRVRKKEKNKLLQSLGSLTNTMASEVTHLGVAVECVLVLLLGLRAQEAPAGRVEAD